MNEIDLAGMALGCFLTVSILSYLLLDDNLFFRLGAHLLVGVSAGYLLAIMFKTVLWDRYFGMIPSLSLAQIPGVLLLTLLSLLMFSRLLPRGSSLGMIPMAFLVGVGAAVVVGGALTGTFLPQAVAAAQTNLLPLAAGSDFLGTLATMAENWFVLLGTLATLAYFHFGARPRGGLPPVQPQPIRTIALAGKGVIMITLGALYAGALLSSLAILTERIYFLLHVVSGGTL